MMSSQFLIKLSDLQIAINSLTRTIDTSTRALEKSINKAPTSMIKIPNGKWIVFGTVTALAMGTLGYIFTKKYKAYIPKPAVMLFNAIKNNEKNAVSYLLTKHPNLFIYNDFECVRVACESGHLEMVEYLYEYGLQETQKNKKHYSLFILNKGGFAAHNNAAIIIACKLGHKNIVEFLIKHFVDVNAQDGLPLIYAAKHYHKDIVEMLLKAGANPNARQDEALKIALQAGRKDVVKDILDASIDKNMEIDLSSLVNL